MVTCLSGMVILISGWNHCQLNYWNHLLCNKAVLRETLGLCKYFLLLLPILNSLVPVRCNSNFKSIILKLTIQNIIPGPHFEISQVKVRETHWWEFTIGSDSGLVPSGQCWPRSRSPYGITRPQGVKTYPLFSFHAYLFGCVMILWVSNHHIQPVICQCCDSSWCGSQHSLNSTASWHL